MSAFTSKEVASLVEAGYTLEEIIEYQEKKWREWENMKRLWDGRPQLPPRRRKNQVYRSIDESWVPTKKSEPHEAKNGLPVERE